MKVNKEKEALLSHEELLRILDYDTLSGIFRWKISGNGRKIGDIAGSIGNGRLSININKLSYYANRLAWFYLYNKWPSFIIDHININPLDNRIVNLRDISQKNNTENTNNRKCKIYKSITGVYYDKNYDKWNVRIQVNNISTYFGSFDTRQEAESECIILKKIHYKGFIDHQEGQVQ